MTKRIITGCMRNLKLKIKISCPNIEKSIGYNPHDIKPLYLLCGWQISISPTYLCKPFNVSAGFKSDGCSIPWVFRLILGCKHNPKYVVASIIHDYIVENPQVVDYNRKLSSQIFYNILLKEKVNKYLAYVLYLGVEIGQIYNTIFKGKWRNHEQRTLYI